MATGLDNGFDPQNLDNRVSLNRTRLEGHEAIPLELRGLQAWDLLSARALRRVLGTEQPALGAGGGDSIRAYDLLLSRTADGSADASALRFGEYLGYLLLSLLRSRDQNSAYRRHWQAVRCVVLGGGIVRGALGRRLQQAALTVLDAAGCSGVALALAPNPHLVGLVGAARSMDNDAPSALVYDFGNSNVKRGLAHYRGGTLVSLDVKAPVTTNGLPDAIAGTTDAVPAQRLADFMTDLIAGDWRASVQSETTPCRQIVASIACYLRDGQPLAYDAGYASLRLLSDNAAAYLSGAVSTAVGTGVTITLSHDGTTAARVYAGQPRTAVVMLGTWLGVGFAPESDAGLRLMAPEFSIAEA